MISEIIKLSKKIYHTDNPRELHRFIVFIARAMLHASDMKRLYEWYQQDELRRRVLDDNPFIMEQVTRQFFYKGSTFSERVKIVQQHTSFIQSVFKTESAFLLLGDTNGIEIWRGDYDGHTDWEVHLAYDAGQRKEGLLGLDMDLNHEHLYQMIFWVAFNRDGEPSMYIGAMQGPNCDNARNLVKAVTKKCHRYRTKNLILYMTQAVARAMGLKHIYAVTNRGYYAQNHARRNRKLKTDFGAFWQEVGGKALKDERFYELPLIEHRKTMEEVPTRKRAVYRRRFAFQDEVDCTIEQSISELRRK